ncbi:hypothetical protein EGW08_015514 [Elysia chlorotica]|uniref:Uncharacterized protein n=1 Tax=Elysia chlorotica TaxID=188477 RepID=A0A433T5B7_ELYCH|nr:hypothetical protein EGW08_015514 [Elysia chlorotica]
MSDVNAYSRSSARPNRNILFQNGGVLLFLLLAALCVAPLTGSRHVSTRAARFPCAQCNTQDLPDAVFARRYLSTCMACGEMFGREIAHCCMCYEEFTNKCNTALRRR